jgi:antitoxin (DNA-binding transcriptional repressor) of toxin-antitoxin stability system
MISPDTLRLAEGDEVVITRHGRPAGGLIGFHSEEEWFDYRLESDARFLNRVERARQRIRDGDGIPLEKLARERRPTRRCSGLRLVACYYYFTFEAGRSR